jgi:hypothetical protein
MHLPWWFVLLSMLSLTVPVTSLVLVGTGIGWLISRKKGRFGPARLFAWSTVAIAPFWLAGTGFGVWMISGMMAEDAERARLNYKMREATVIDGVDIPAGAMVSRYNDGTLRAVSLPDGMTLAASGATWQHVVDFGARGWVTDGSLAADAVIQGIPCRHDHIADFWNKDQLRGCTLSRDTTVEVTIKDTGGASRTQSLSCRAETPIETQLVGHGEVGVCTLAAPAEIGGVGCAAGTELKLVNGMLSSCTVATPTRFGPIELPPGSFVAYVAGRPEWFRLPPSGPAVDAFGLNLPPGTEASFCYQSEALQRLAVDQTAYVTVEGVKLTGAIDFDCGRLQRGVLFEDAMVGGKRRQGGEIVSQADLSPQ